MSSERDPVEAAVKIDADDLTPPMTVPLLDDVTPSADESSAGNGKGESSTPARRAGRIPNHVLEAVAALVVNGARYEDISTSTGLPVPTLQRMVTGDSNKHFTALLDGYRTKVLRATAHHQMRLLELMDSSYSAIGRALAQDDDPKLAKDTAFQLMDRVIPQASAPEVEVNLGFQNVHLQQTVQNTFGKIAESFDGLLEKFVEQDPNKFLRDEVPHMADAHETVEVSITAAEGTPTDAAD